jgi:drug/metabolite transporter (DMT)-like permease
LNLESVLTALIAWLAFREHASLRTVSGMAAIVGGGIVLTWSGAEGSNVSSWLIAAACCCWAIDNNLTRRISASDPLQIVAVKSIVGAAINAIIFLAMSGGSAYVPGSALISAGLVGALGYGVSLVLYVLALRELGTARTGAYFSTAPFLGATIAVALGGAHVTPTLAIAGALMLLGVWLHLTERHEHFHTHEALEHEHAHVHDEHHHHAHGPSDPPGELHTHVHRHEALAHTHPHAPDMHHRHVH